MPIMIGCKKRCRFINHCIQMVSATSCRQAVTRRGQMMTKRPIKTTMWLLAGTLVASMGLHTTSAVAQDGKWRMAKQMLAPQGEIVSVVIGKKWFVMGGYDGANVQARGIVNVYDAEADTWIEKKNMQIPAHHASAVELNGK